MQRKRTTHCSHCLISLHSMRPTQLFSIIFHKQRNRVITAKGLKDIIDTLIIRCIHILPAADNIQDLLRKPARGDQPEANFRYRQALFTLLLAEDLCRNLQLLHLGNTHRLTSILAFAEPHPILSRLFTQHINLRGRTCRGLDGLRPDVLKQRHFYLFCLTCSGSEPSSW